MVKSFSLGALAAALIVMFAAPALALELLMVERPGCAWCARWDNEIGPIYPKTREGYRAPLSRAGIHDLPRGISFKRPIVYTPTFVLIEADREIGRITGYAGEDVFWGLLDELLKKQHTARR